MNARLGIIDWGIGGISIYKLIDERMTVPVTYLSDTGVTPYGKMGRKELSSRLDNVIDFLKTRGVTHVVIGCNAASTAIPFLRDHGIPVLGVIESAVETAAAMKPKSLGLIGGRRTVVSGVYKRAFAERGIELKQRVAQPLSGMIEKGDISSPELHEQCRRILLPLKNCSHILLACTHYPAITDVLGRHVPTNTKLIDPAKDLINKIKAWNLKGSGKDEFLTTGDPAAMKKAAKAAFSVHLPKVQRVSF
jgi:glutamate racemase